MKKRLFLFLFMFVCCFDYVYADDIQTINFGFNNGYVNSSKTNSSVNRGSCSATTTASDSGPTFNNNFNLYLLKKGKETTPGTVTKSIPYSIVIMVDTTVSMKGKTDATNNAVKAIIDIFKGTDSYVAVYSFNSSLSTPKSLLGQKGFTDVNNALKNYKPLTNNSVDGQSTNLQSGVITAYRLLRDNFNKHPKTAPMLIFITDGYPTVGYSTDAVDKTDRYYSSSLIKSSGTKVTASSARIAYYAAKTFATFAKKISTLGYDYEYKNYFPLITYGIRLKSFTQTDEYLDFILNPSEDKFNKLNSNDETLFSTESKTLYNLISSSGKKETFYETVARFDDYPDAGVFKGVVKYNKKEKKYVVKYYIPKNRWDSIKKSEINSNKQFRVYCSGGAFTNVKNLNTNKLSTEGNFYVYTKKCDSVGTYSSSNFKNGWFVNNINSMTGNIDKLKEDLSYLVNQSINVPSDPVTNLDDGQQNIKYTLKNVNGTTHDYSANIDVPLSGKLYYKLPDTLEFDAISNSQDVKVKLENLKFMRNLNFDSSSAIKNCVQLKNASVSVVVKNTKSSIEVTRSKKVDYPGSGFEMNASIKSSVAWYYSFLNSSTGVGSPNVNIELKNNDYNIVSGSKDDYSCFSSQDNGSCVHVNKLNYININSIFTDDKCTTEYTEKKLNEKVWNELKERALSDSIEGTDFFESVDSNDKNKKSFISTTVTNPKVPEELLPGETTELVYTFSLNRGCISTANDNVNGTEVTNGSVLYSGEIGHDGNDNTCINTFGSKFINGMSSLGNNQYFIPTDYPDKTVSIELNDKSFSIIHGVELKYDLECDVDVGGSVLKYNFRTIDVNNPFPGGKKGKDWEEWYNKSSNVSRMANSYSNPYYSVTFGSHTFWNTGSYLSWSNMNANGSSTFIDDKFEKKAGDTSYCSIGYFSDDCDK